MRTCGIVIPLLLITYSLLVDAPISSRVLSFNDYMVVMVPWVLVSLVIYFLPASTQGGVIGRLLAYHLCAGAYIILIADFSIPFVTLGWLLLLLISYIYSSSRGLVINLLVLLLITTIDIMTHQGDTDRMLIDIIAVFSISIIGTVVISLNAIQQDDSDALLRSKLEETLQRDRLNTLINSLSDAVIGIDAEGRIEVYNAASLDLLNTNASLFGQPIDEIIKVQNQSGKEIRLFQSAAKTGRSRMRDDLSMTSGEETVRLSVTSSPIRSSFGSGKEATTPDGYVLILRDITKAKSLEEERDEFISVVSHELRTPITIAEGTLSNMELMVERGQIPPDTLEKSLANAHNQILFLSKMVNDLGTLSRAERGIADTPEEIDVKDLVNNLFSEYAPQAESKGLRFDIDMSGQLGTVTTSPLYLRELLQNLITNAIKYTKEGSVVLRAKQSGNNIIFEVKDTGIGISKGDQARIFDKFYRSEDYRTRETGGTGLGLYVTAKLARKIGTAIAVKSRLNHGSSFSFSLPGSPKE